MKPVFVAVCFSLLLSQSVEAQLRTSGYVGTLIDDNAFNNYLRVEDRLTEVSLNGAYEWDSDNSNLQVFYTGSLTYFSLLPSRTFQVHEGGVAYSYLVSEVSGTLLNTGISLSIRNNREEYDIFDHSQFSVYANMRSELSDFMIIKGGYTFRSVSFSALTEFTYTEHYAYLQCALTLPTRTTLIVQTDVGFKLYSIPNASSTTDDTGIRGNGQRLSEGPLPGVTQLLGTVRIGQGITDGTGLSVTGQYQVSVHKDLRYLTFSDGVLTDDEFFDDHYGYEGPLAAVMLTQLLPAEMRFRISASLQQRDYSNRPALDLTGAEVDPQRIDHRRVLSLSLEKSISSLGLTANLTYDSILNSSNDLFYSYSNNALSLRLSVGY